MNGVQQIIAVGLVFFVNLGCSSVFCEATHSDDSLSRVRRGGWSMLRLGRGLQMLRLGKRMHQDNLLDDFKSYLNQDRDFHERQVPLPRYGKDLDWQNYLESQILGNSAAIGQKRESNLPLSDSIVAETIEGYPHLRPAPRGGRFKRSTGYSLYYPDVQAQERAVALPRFGRWTEKEIKYKDESKERAVPAPSS